MEKEPKKEKQSESVKGPMGHKKNHFLQGKKPSGGGKK